MAENESNRRLVEWQEKSAEMESSRLELENAYAQLSEYYQQLQQAYNELYIRVHAYKVESSVQTVLDNNALAYAQVRLVTAFCIIVEQQLKAIFTLPSKN